MRGARLMVIATTCAGTVGAVAPGAQARRVASPSGTIVCSDAGSVDRLGITRGVVCSISEQSFLPSRGCDGGYNPSAFLGPSGRSRRVDQCGGLLGSLGSGPVRTVRVGSRVTIDGVTCRSLRGAFRCTNRSGRGFRISARALQRFQASAGARLVARHPDDGPAGGGPSGRRGAPADGAPVPPVLRSVACPP